MIPLECRYTSSKGCPTYHAVGLRNLRSSGQAGSLCDQLCLFALRNSGDSGTLCNQLYLFTLRNLRLKNSGEAGSLFDHLCQLEKRKINCNL
ncbi:uncharacterized protein [Dysidea avara]|uniref:uncharacterized protein n=1 Tax=Dysidea avara TaxID=196820 RepID=UPI00331C27FD